MKKKASAKKENIAVELKTRGSKARQDLAQVFREMRAAEVGKTHLPFNVDRHLSQAPFHRGLTASVVKRIRANKRKVVVLDKGAGTGRMLAGVKQFSPRRIHTTALALGNALAPAHKSSINQVVGGFGLRVKHKRKFDIIYDCYGEDYHLPKRYVKHSIEVSLSNLKPGGELFTVLPLTHRSSRVNFTVEEGKRLVKELRVQGLKVTTKETPKRFNKIEYVDLVIHITKP